MSNSRTPFPTSGMYADLNDSVERLVSMKASKYKIPGYEREDVAQEIRMVAFKALQKYDATKNHSTPFYFIARCVDNHLINLRRDNDAFISRAKLNVADDSTKQRLEMKRKLYHPLQMEDQDEYTEKHYPNYFEVHETILLYLPSGLHESYWLVAHDGQHAVPSTHFSKIKKVIFALRESGIL